MKPAFLSDHRAVLGKLALGHFLVLPWELVEDHDDWGLELVDLGIDLGVDVWRMPITAKSLTVIMNGDRRPPDDAIHNKIRWIEYRRFMARDERRLVVAGHRVTPGGLAIPSA